MEQSDVVQGQSKGYYFQVDSIVHAQVKYMINYSWSYYEEKVYC